MCSEKPCGLEDCQTLELTPESLCQFAAHLKGGSIDELVEYLGEYLGADIACQQLCLKFIIGSVAVFEQVDVEALSVICELCTAHRIEFLSDLSTVLAKSNDSTALAQFAAQNAGSIKNANLFGEVIAELVKANWSVMRELTMKILTIARDNPAQHCTYYFMLRSLPIEMQYRMINNGSVPLSLLGSIYHLGIFDLQLREIFFLARCSNSPNPQIRSYIADQNHYYKQFLGDCTAKEGAIPCSNLNFDLDVYIWSVIFTFVDVETLILVLPLVCVSWRELYSKTLTHSTAVHEMFLQDLNHVGLSRIHKAAPWKYCLPNKTIASKYLGLCVVYGTLHKSEPVNQLQSELAGYLDDVTAGIVPPPVTKVCAAEYGLFLKLFEEIYRFRTLTKPILCKPVFFTEEEYERAIYHFVYEERWILALPKPWIVNNMSKLFSIIREDEELMKELMVRNFDDFVGTSIALILHGRTDRIPEKLSQLIFPQTGLFERFANTGFTDLGRYYNFIVEYNILPELLVDKNWMTELCQLMISLILSFKGDPDKTDAIVMSTADRVLGLPDYELGVLRWRIGVIFPDSVKGIDECLPSDIHYVEEVMTRCGLLDESKT